MAHLKQKENVASIAVRDWIGVNDMERLTEKWDEHFIARTERLNGKIVGNQMCLDKLGALEDLEEQGLLLRLPCKVGDTVYYIKGGYYKKPQYCEVKPIEVTEISLKNNRSGKSLDWAIIANGTRYKISSIGKTVFLTREEAEAALEKMKGEEHEFRH